MGDKGQKAKDKGQKQKAVRNAERTKQKRAKQEKAPAPISLKTRP